MKKKMFAIAAAALFALGGIGFTATQWGSGPSLAERNAEALAANCCAPIWHVTKTQKPVQGLTYPVTITSCTTEGGGSHICSFCCGN